MSGKISKTLRFEVFKRDGFVCRYCGRKPPEVVLNADHVLPASKGGLAELQNLVTSCQPCNLGKGARLLGNIPAPLALDEEANRESLDQLKAYNEYLSERQELWEDWREEILKLWAILDGQEAEAETWFFHKELEGAVLKFVRLLPGSEVRDAVRVAFDRYPRGSDRWRFKYFCGVCWKKIRGDKPKEDHYVCEAVQQNS